MCFDSFYNSYLFFMHFWSCFFSFEKIKIGRNYNNTKIKGINVSTMAIAAAAATAKVGNSMWWWPEKLNNKKRERINLLFVALFRTREREKSAGELNLCEWTNQKSFNRWWIWRWISISNTIEHILLYENWLFHIQWQHQFVLTCIIEPRCDSKPFDGLLQIDYDVFFFRVSVPLLIFAAQFIVIDIVVIHLFIFFYDSFSLVAVMSFFKPVN